MSKSYNVAIMGATGAVGNCFLRILEQRKFPINNLRLLASERSKGIKLKFNGKLYPGGNTALMEALSEADAQLNPFIANVPPDFLPDTEYGMYDDLLQKRPRPF